MGIMDVADARTVADEKGLDLVEVAPLADPPVCRIVNVGRYMYEQQKRHRRQKPSRPKVVKIHTRTSDHDLSLKFKQVDTFRQHGHAVHLILDLRGRERSRLDDAEQFLLGLLAKHEIHEREIHRSSARISAMIAPRQLSGSELPSHP